MTRFPRPRRKPRGTIRGTRNGKAPVSSLKPRRDLYSIRYPSISSNSLSPTKDISLRYTQIEAASLPFGATLRAVPGRS